MKATRASWVWRYSRKGSNWVRIESQGRGDYFYSKDNANKAEEIFRKLEDGYGLIIARVWRHEQNQGDDQYFGLILMMISLHLRGPAYEIRASQERGLVQLGLEEDTLNQYIMESSTENFTPDEWKAKLKQNWRVALLEVTGIDGLITSDNASTWITANDHNALHCMLLPLTPNVCAVAYDRRYFETTSAFLGPREVAQLNAIQVENCCDAVFSSVEIATCEAIRLQDQLNKKKRPPGYVDDKVWRANIRMMAKEFSFLRRTSMT